MRTWLKPVTEKPASHLNFVVVVSHWLVPSIQCKVNSRCQSFSLSTWQTFFFQGSGERFLPSQKYIWEEKQPCVRKTRATDGLYFLNVFNFCCGVALGRGRGLMEVEPRWSTLGTGALTCGCKKNSSQSSEAWIHDCHSLCFFEGSFNGLDKDDLLATLMTLSQELWRRSFSVCDCKRQAGGHSECGDHNTPVGNKQQSFVLIVSPSSCCHWWKT